MQPNRILRICVPKIQFSSIFQIFCIILLLIKLSVVAEELSDAYSSIIWDEQEFSSLSRNATRCSRTELSLGKESLLHTWKIKGLTKYLHHVKNFDQSFETMTEEISFKSDTVDGKWIFRISKSSTQANAKSELRISSTYSYEAREQKKIHFGIQLTVTQNDREIVLPLAKSTKPVVVQPQPIRSKTSTRILLQSSLPLEFVYSFSWPDILPEFEKNLSGGNWDEDLTLIFSITAYFPHLSMSSSPESCNEVETVEFLRGKIPLHPPFWKHGNSMLHDDRYTDLVIRVGADGFRAHRIVLAASSAVFSSILYNKSELEQNNGSTTIIEISDDHDAKVVEEMLRYIYTGRVESLPEFANKLILLAYQYQLLELKKLCEATILARVTPATAMEVYALGKEVMSPKLTTNAFNVMRANKGKIVSQADEFRNLTLKYPNLMLELFLSS